MAGKDMEGGCACRRVRFRARVNNDDAYLCHCRMCQRATGAVSVAFKNLPQANVEWLSGPDWYDSSPIARRPYCANCGTSLGFQYKQGPNLDVMVAAFDDPSRFRPTSHFGVESMHRRWINTEGLPEQSADDYKPLAERWKAAADQAPAG